MPENGEVVRQNAQTDFTRSTLHKVYNRHGKGIQEIDDLYDFDKALIEAGMVGRVTPSQSDRYVEGKFEYTQPHRLHVSEEDLLCLPPLTLDVYSAKKAQEQSTTKKCIYPYGAQVDADDYRGDLK